MNLNSEPKEGQILKDCLSKALHNLCLKAMGVNKMECS